jgi:hypothetical protein
MVADKDHRFIQSRQVFSSFNIDMNNIFKNIFYGLACDKLLEAFG